MVLSFTRDWRIGSDRECECVCGDQGESGEMRGVRFGKLLELARNKMLCRKPSVPCLHPSEISVCDF